jgi:L-ascorbate metabolism protein UlaG (beta-lactamase superfamily)
LEITWFGHSCFRIVERGRVTVVTDPFSDAIGIAAPKLKADVVTISHDVPGHNHVETVKGDPQVLRGPGEYEIGGVFIAGQAMHDPESRTPEINVGYQFDYDGLSVLHLGDLSHIPSQSTIEELGTVNVLLLPVGGGQALKAAQAAEVVALIEPYFVVPMHYALPGLAFELEPLDKFLKAMGVSKVQEADTLRVSASDVPEQPQVVVLRPQV